MACLELGLDHARLLASVGLDNFPEESDEPVAAAVVLRLLENARRMSGCEHIALLIAKHQSNRFLGSLGLMLASAPDLGSAWREAGRYYQVLRNSDLYWRFNSTPTNTQMSFGLHSSSEVFSTTAMELSVAKSFSWSRSITNGRWKPLAVCFRHTRSSNMKPYRQFFQTPLHFEADFDGFLLTPKDLSIPLGSADDYLHSSLKEILAKPELAATGGDLLGRARFYIAQGLAEGDYHLDDLARRFNMSARSLQRQLTRRGHQYQDLLDEVRLNISGYYLQYTDLRVGDVAMRVGYQTARTFCSAFKLQTGQTPLQWRKTCSGNTMPAASTLDQATAHKPGPGSAG